MQLLLDYLTTLSALLLSWRGQEDESYGPLIRYLKQLFTALCGKNDLPISIRVFILRYHRYK